MGLGLTAADAITLVGVIAPISGIVIVGVLRMNPRQNGKYTTTEVCQERHKNINAALARIESKIDALGE